MSRGIFSYNDVYSMHLNNLVRLILRMKLYASKILSHAEGILKEYTLQEKQKILLFESKLKLASIALEDSVNIMLALNHPMGFDLRFILASLKVSSEISYIASWVKKSVQGIERIEKANVLKKFQNELMQMINISFRQLKGIISILLQFDNKRKVAHEVIPILDEMLAMDNLVDGIYRNIMEDSISSIKSHTDNAILVFEIIGIAKNFEKVSDCITNIIATTKYVLTGKRIQYS